MALKWPESHLKSSPFWDVTQRRLVVINVLGQRNSCICRGQAVFLDCLILENGTDRFSQHVGNYQSTLSNILEEWRSHLHRGASLKWRITHVETGSVPVFKREWRGTQPTHCDPTERAVLNQQATVVSLLLLTLSMQRKLARLCKCLWRQK